MKFYILLLLLCIRLGAYAQGSFRLYFENDVLATKDKGDRFYTNGIKFERIHPVVMVGFLEKIFPEVREKTSTAYSWAIGQNMYTARDITVPDIIPGDRPYAGWLYFNLKKYSNSNKVRRRISSELSLGVIGPAALAGPVQKAVHKVIDSSQPAGWSHQIRNSPAINYSLELEDQLYDSDNSHLDMIWFTNAEIGTVFDNFGMGAMIRIAPFRVLDSYFESTFSKQTTIREKREGIEGTNSRASLNDTVSIVVPTEKKKLAIYFFIKPSVRFVAYNALLQGGVFTGRSNDRSISPNELERMYLNFDVGVVIPLGYRFDFVYGQSFRTAEFRDAPVHYWGFINLIYNQRKSRP